MNVVLDDAEEVWVKVSKKAEGEASSNGRVRREYGDRKTLGWSLLTSRQRVDSIV
jgi:small nuclear ribonucleoprotein (snRNP)-like protein